MGQVNRSSRIFAAFWYTKEAEEAAKFYTSIFPDSRVDRVSSLAVDSPSGPAGSVKVVDFTLFGQRFQAMSAGPLDPFNHAISMCVLCEDQKELDKYWEGLLQGGGKPEQCGWLRDRFGVSWQVIPTMMDAWLGDTDKARAKRVQEQMLKMVKLDFAPLQAAYDGKK